MLSIPFYKSPPLLHMSNKTGKFELAGTLSVAFYVFQQCLKFDYVASDFLANPGQIGSTGNMTRIEIAIQRQGYDLLLMIQALSKKATYDTLFPTVTRSYMFVVRRPTIDTTHVFYIILAPFQTLSWAAFLSAFIIITSVLYLIQRIREQAILAEALDAITRAMVQQGSVYQPKEASGRVVFFIGYFTMFILFAYYSCALTSIMTIEQYALGIESLEDLVNSDFQILVTDGAASFVDESLQVNTSATYKKLARKIKSNQNSPMPIQNAFDELCKERVAVMDSQFALQAMSLDGRAKCRLFFLPIKVMYEYYSYPLKKNGPLKFRLNKCQRTCVDVGIKYLTTAMNRQPLYPPSEYSEDSGLISLSIFHLRGILLIACVGLGTALLALAVEIIVWNIPS